VCGIYGVVSVTHPIRTDPKILQDMASTLVHRGPDGSGEFVDDRAALGVRLLRIIDRANPITQPFRDPATGVVVVCNGEIYNSPEIRKRYRDFPFRTGSDVESIVPLFLDKGSAGIADLDGMYALAIWDPRTREIILARDPQGEKPLFAANIGGLLVFGSEIRTLLAHPGVGTSANTSAIADILTLGYTVGAKTMFENIWSVEPGSAGKVAGSTWNYEPATGTASIAPDDPSDSLDELLEAAVARQLNADVPVGVFSSGGVDSSLLAAYATKAMAPTKLHTFAIGFEEPSYDERDPARAVARHLGTQHIEVLATARDLAAQLHTMIDRMAEPIPDPAVLPTALLATEAKRHVGVVLSGEGADELFGGYPTYPGHAAAARYGRLPSAVRSVIKRIVNSLPVSDTKVPIRLLLKRFVAQASKPAFNRHVAWFGAQIDDRLLSVEAQNIWGASVDRFDDLSRVMYFDYCTYLRALLAKIDRATMLSSLESRAPYLDPRVRCCAFALPDHLKTDGLRTKPLLKHVASRYLPRNIVRRRKRGLSVPVNQIMRTELRAEFDSLVRDERFEHLGLLPPGLVGELVSQHRDRHADHGRALWTLLVLGMWTERWMGA
jgi:asparagine synthase (glutamine-hydrolysing)